MTLLEILLAVGLIMAGLFVWLSVRNRTMTQATVEGCTIKIHQDRENTWIVYTESSGKSLTVEAYWVNRKKPKEMRVEFPSTVSFAEPLSPRPSGDPTQLQVPNTRSSSVPLPESKVAEIKERVSLGLKKLKIPHDFVRPQLSGWTSIEDGREIYHGTDGVPQDRN